MFLECKQNSLEVDFCFNLVDFKYLTCFFFLKIFFANIYLFSCVHKYLGTHISQCKFNHFKEQLEF